MKRMMPGNQSTDYSGHVKKVAKGAGIRLAGSVFGRAILLINTLLLASLLTTGDLGLYFLSLSISFVATRFGLMGLKLGVIRFVSMYSGRSAFNSVSGTLVSSLILTFVCSTFITLGLFATRDWISTSVFGEPGLASVLGIFIFAIPVDAVRTIFLSATEGLKYMQYTVYVEEVIVLALRLALIVIFVWVMEMGVGGAAVSYLLSAIAGLLAAFIFCSRKVALIGKGARPEYRIKELLSFSLPLMPASIMLSVSRQVSVIMLGWLGTASAVGIYSIAARLINLPMVVARAFQAIFNPVIADLYAKKDLSQLSKLFTLTTRWSASTNLPVFIMFILFPSFFMGLFGAEISTGAACLSILASAHVLSIFSVFASSMIAMSGRSHLVLINNLLFILLNVILNFTLIPRYGILGAAIGYAAAFVLLAGLRVGEMVKTIKIHPFQFPVMKPIIASMMYLLPMCIYFGINARLSLSVMLPSVMASILIYMTILVILRLDDDDRYIVSILKRKASRAQSDA